MIANKWKKTIKSLHSKKHRTKEGLFLVEGAKAVSELLRSNFSIEFVCCSEEYEKEFSEIYPELIVTDSQNINSISSLKVNKDALAVVKVSNSSFESNFVDNQYLSLVLDNIQDPGNLGTIIRLADWYGIKNVICSNDCVDFYNPKTIHATMGSFCRVQPMYEDLTNVLEKLNNESYNIFSAMMEGGSVYNLEHNTVLNAVILGNEANGVRAEIQKMANKSVSIPRVGTTESLNVAMATGIICDNFIRVQ